MLMMFGQHLQGQQEQEEEDLYKLPIDSITFDSDDLAHNQF